MDAFSADLRSDHRDKQGAGQPKVFFLTFLGNHDYFGPFLALID
jgi:hypothetical protein